MRNRKLNILVKVGVLAAIAFLLQALCTILPIPKVGGFLDIEISDLPAIFGALALGPVAGVAIELIKNILHLSISTTSWIGELANFVINGTFVLVIGLIYQNHKNKKGAILSLLIGTVVLTVAAMLANYFIMLPLYMPATDMGAKMQIILYTITPFNFVRGLSLSLITVFIYKPLSPLLHNRL